MNNTSLPSTSHQSNFRYFNLLNLAKNTNAENAENLAPIDNDTNNEEMDEYAPLRMTILLIGTLICLLIYFLLKVWRRRDQTTRMPIKQSKDSTSGEWTTALLDEVSDEDELFLR